MTPIEDNAEHPEPLTLPGTDLVPTEEWRIDEHTREVGRRGLAEARAALTAATRRASLRHAERSSGTAA